MNKRLRCRVSPHSRPLGSLRLSADFRPTPGLLSSYRKPGIVFSDKPHLSGPCSLTLLDPRPAAEPTHDRAHYDACE
jgi:hypothetical protein